MRLSPMYPAWCPETLAWSHFLMRQYDEAEAFAQEATAIDTDYVYTWVVLAMTYAEAEQWEHARQAVQQVLRIDPEFCIRRFANTQPFADQAVLERHLRSLRSAGVPDGNSENN